MRNTRWLRASLASMTVIGLSLGAFVVACGDDDTGGGGTTPGVDSGPDAKTDTGASSSGNTSSSSSGGVTDAGDSGPKDSGGDGEGGTGPAPAKIYFVHGGTSLGNSTEFGVNALSGGVRVCFQTSTDNGATFSTSPFAANPTDASIPGAPPGLYIGQGGVYPTSGVDLEPFAIRPFLMNAKTLAAKGIVGADPTVPRCPKLLADGGLDGGPTENLKSNQDFWQLPDIPTGSLKKGHTYLLAITGCTSDATALPGFCGNNPSDSNPFVPDASPGPGNLKVLVLELDTATTVAGDELAAGVVNLSPQQTATLPLGALGTGPFHPRIINTSDYLDGGGPGTDAGDGSGPPVFKLTTETPSGTTFDRAVTAPTALVKLKGVATDTGYFAFSENVSPTTGQVGNAKLNNVNAPVVQRTVQFASTGSTDTTQLYVNGKAYTFILVGDPGLNDGGYGSRAMHFVGFPNQQ